MEHNNMLINNEDSYAERRQLFKNIWDTAMNIDDKDPDIMNKPKVIKTLRLDEADNISKKKKQKLKHLRTVCNRILDFCDRQEADDRYYEQLTKPQASPTIDLRPKKTKRVHVKRKMRKFKSLQTNSTPKSQRVITPVDKNEFNAGFASTARYTTVKKAGNTRKKGSKENNDSQGLEKYKYYCYVGAKPVVPVQSPKKNLLHVHKLNMT